MCVEGVKQRAQYTALWGAGTEAEGGGCVTAHSHPLAAVGQKALNPHAGVVWKSQVPQYVHQSVGKDGIECRTKVHKEHPHIAP